MLQARRDSNPQPPVLETGALPIELRTSGCFFPASLGGHHGQGQNRTADTMIFSHVLYQLSYLAQKKNPPEPRGAGGESRERPELPSLPSRPLPRAPRIGNSPQDEHYLGIVSKRGKRRQRRRFTSNSGGRIRTCDLRVMSPTSYQTAPPRNRAMKLVAMPTGGQPASLVSRS